MGNIGQGSLSLSNKADAATVAGAKNGVSLDGTDVVLGSPLGDTSGDLLDDRQIGGAHSVGMPLGKFGVGLDPATLSTYVQNLVAQGDTFTNENVSGVAFIRLTLTPNGAAVIGTAVPMSAQLFLNLSNGSVSGGVGTAIAAVKAVTIIQGNDGTKSSQPLIGMIAKNLPIGVVNISDFIAVLAGSPDASAVDPTSHFDRIIGCFIEKQDSLTLNVPAPTYGLYQEGPNDLNFVAGLANRSSISSVVVRNNTSSVLQKIAGASGNFTTVDLKTVTVVDGIITSIV